jgi:hypothetical protein
VDADLSSLGAEQAASDGVGRARALPTDGRRSTARQRLVFLMQAMYGEHDAAACIVPDVEIRHEPT